MTYPRTEKIYRKINEFPIDLCFFIQEMSARAIDHADIPEW